MSDEVTESDSYSDALHRAKAEAWEEGWNALADAIETCTVAGGEPCGAPLCAICDQDNPYRDEAINDHP